MASGTVPMRFGRRPTLGGERVWGNGRRPFRSFISLWAPSCSYLRSDVTGSLRVLSGCCGGPLNICEHARRGGPRSLLTEPARLLGPTVMVGP